MLTQATSPGSFCVQTTPSPREAAELVRRIGAGDSSAEDQLIEVFSRVVLSLLRRRCGSLHLAEDLHQETFQVVLIRLRGRGLAEPGKVSGFILRTARNLWIQHCRKASRRSDLLERADLGPDRLEPNPIKELRHEELCTQIRDALGRLRNSRDREILRRFYLLEEDKQRLCRDYELGSLQFNVILFRARQRLKAEFGDWKD